MGETEVHALRHIDLNINKANRGHHGSQRIRKNHPDEPHRLP
jgi:hypothetical protein